MDKRQDTLQIHHSAAWLALSWLFMLLMAACQTTISPAPIEDDPPGYVVAADTPVVSPTVSSTRTPQIQAVTPTADCLQQGGDVQGGSIFSQHLGEDLHYQVYLPPCYQTNTEQRYPVLYLLHGLSYNEDQWIRLGAAEAMDRLIAEGTISPLIIILPREARFQPPQVSGFADALIEELLPWVDQHYRTQPEKAFRAIGGLSRGAAWSVRIGFEQAAFFSSVGAHSLPLFEFDGGRLNAWLAQIPLEDVPEIFIDIGRSDPERSTAQAFADQLDENNVPHTWFLFNGGHTEDYWTAHLDVYLRWYARDW